LGLVDAAILGHLDDTQYLASVAIGGALLSFLYWGFSFLRMGTTGLVAKAMGAGKESEASLVLAQSAVLALGLAVIAVALHPLWLGLGLALMSPQGDIALLANSYASIRIFSSPAVLVTYAIVGWFIGRQNTRWPMLIVIITNCANIGLDFLFIIEFQLFSDGAAYATVLAEYLGCALALYAVWKVAPATEAGFYAQLRNGSAYRRLLRSNRDLFIRTMCLLFSFAFFTAMGEKLGEDVLAANTLMMQLVLMAAYGMDGFAFSAEALAGTRLGARDMPGFYRAVKYCAAWCAATALAMSTLFLLFYPLLFSLLTDIESVTNIMRESVPWLILLPLIAAPSYLLDGVFIGSAETHHMMTTMLFSMAVVYLPLWYLSQGFGNHGLWFAFSAFNMSRGIALYRCYSRLSRGDLWLTEQN
jgi:MATE family multidrug resistance protein